MAHDPDLEQELFEQGFGSRRECAALVARAAARRIAGATPPAGLPVAGLPPGHPAPGPDGRWLVVEGQAWPVQAQALLMLHKPAGWECSQAPRHHPSVLSLLPAPLRRRGVQPVGRLDQDTTGLLLFTDEGRWLHRLTHPRWHVPKVYRLMCESAVDEAAREALLQGVVLRDDPAPARALACRALPDGGLELTLDEGRYHQVKRMLAAVGHRVTALHRCSVGPVQLPEDLAPGQWRWLPEADRTRLLGALDARARRGEPDGRTGSPPVAAG